MAMPTAAFSIPRSKANTSYPIFFRSKFRRADIKNPGLFDPGAAGGDDFVPRILQDIDQVGADKAGRAGDKNPHLK